MPKSRSSQIIPGMWWGKKRTVSSRKHVIYLSHLPLPLLLFLPFTCIVCQYHPIPMSLCLVRAMQPPRFGTSAKANVCKPSVDTNLMWTLCNSSLMAMRWAQARMMLVAGYSICGRIGNSISLPVNRSSVASPRWRSPSLVVCYSVAMMIINVMCGIPFVLNELGCFEPMKIVYLVLVSPVTGKGCALEAGIVYWRYVWMGHTVTLI